MFMTILFLYNVNHVGSIWGLPEIDVSVWFFAGIEHLSSVHVGILGSSFHSLLKALLRLSEHVCGCEHSNFDATVYSETQKCFHFCLPTKSSCCRGRLQMRQYGRHWSFGHYENCGAL